MCEMQNASFAQVYNLFSRQLAVFVPNFWDS